MEAKRDLMQYLLDGWKAEHPEAGVIAPNVLDEFADWARAFLHKNQPIAVDNLQRGIGIRFQDATVVPFVPEEDEFPVDNTPAVMITKPKTGFGNKGGVSPSFSAEITGEKKS